VGEEQRLVLAYEVAQLVRERRPAIAQYRTGRLKLAAVVTNATDDLEGIEPGHLKHLLFTDEIIQRI
jgi:hypothetical protein